MKNSRSDRRQIPVTETAQPTDESPIAVAPETDGSDGNDDPTASLQADLDRFRDLALRSQADFENYKKRAAREKEEAIKYANSSLLERLIAIVDNFELGLSAARGEGERSPIYSGMSMVLKQLTDFLAGQRPPADRCRGAKVRSESARSDRARAERRRRRKAWSSGRRGAAIGSKDRLLRPSSVVVSSGKNRNE